MYVVTDRLEAVNQWQVKCTLCGAEVARMSGPEMSAFILYITQNNDVPMCYDCEKETSNDPNAMDEEVVCLSSFTYLNTEQEDSNNDEVL